MSEKGNGKRCTECGAVGVPQDKELCLPCRIGQDEGPEARRRYLRNLAEKGARASQAKRGQHALQVDALPPLTDHASAKAWLAALAEGVAAGQINRSLASETRKAIKAWLAAHRQEVTDEQLADLREEIAALRERVKHGGEPWR